MLDDKDLHILRLLQNNARSSYADIAEQVGLSVSSIHSRIKRLWVLDYIDRQVVMLNRQKIGYSILCFVHIMLQAHTDADIARFKQYIADMPEVLECYFVTGEYDTILKVVARDQVHLQDILMNRLMASPDVARMQTNLSLEEVKSTTIVPC